MFVQYKQAITKFKKSSDFPVWDHAMSHQAWHATSQPHRVNGHEVALPAQPIEPNSLSPLEDCTRESGSIGAGQLPNASVWGRHRQPW